MKLPADNDDGALLSAAVSPLTKSGPKKRGGEFQ